MRKIILCILTAVISIGLNAQEVRGTLEGVKMLRFNNNVVITGYVRNGDNTVFKATLYDKELNVIKEYSRPIPGKVNTQGGYFYQFGDMFFFNFVAKPVDYFLKLTKDLDELSFTERSSENEKAEPKTSETVRRLQPYNILASIMDKSPYFGPLYKRGIEEPRYLKTDMIVFNYNKKLAEGTFSRNSLMKTSFDNLYNTVWHTPVKLTDVTTLTGYASVTEEEIVACLNTAGKSKFGEDAVVFLESSSGKVTGTVMLKYPDPNQFFFMTNVFYDQETKNIISVGELYPAKGKEEMTAVAVLVYNKNGQLISSKSLEFAKYTVKAPMKFNLKRRAAVAKRIGKLPNGNYFIHVEDQVFGTSGSGLVAGGGGEMVPGLVEESFYPMGYTCYELNNKLEVVLSVSSFREEFTKKDIEYLGSSDDGKNIYISETDKKSKTINVISARDGAMTELKMLDFRKEINYNFNPNYDADYFDAFVGQDHFVTFHKQRASNIFNLQTILIK